MILIIMETGFTPVSNMIEELSPGVKFSEASKAKSCINLETQRTFDIMFDPKMSRQFLFGLEFS